MAGFAKRKMLNESLESWGFLPVRFWYGNWPKQTSKGAIGPNGIAPNVGHSTIFTNLLKADIEWS